MGWHDCILRGIACPVQLVGSEVAFDIDYITQWLPTADGKGFTFEIAPATLVFGGVWSISGELESLRSLQIDSITRADPTTEKQRRAGVYTWSIAGVSFELILVATGFTQFLRMRPVASATQYLSDEQRRGVSFGREPFT